MKYITKRDKFRRNKFSKMEITRLMARSVLRSGMTSLRVKEQVKGNKWISVKFKNRCNLTGRGRSINSYFGLSRIKLLEMARNGELYGMRKGSW